MANTQVFRNKEKRFKMKEPSMFNVILHNDDETTMEFVVFVLVTIFRKSNDDAETLMMKVHNEGSAVAGTYYKDIAESKKNKAVLLARQEGFPLQLTVEEEK